MSDAQRPEDDDAAEAQDERLLAEAVGPEADPAITRREPPADDDYVPM